MPRKKRASWVMYILRLIRPLFHAGLLALVFWGAYHLRQRTDLLPGIQLQIPYIFVNDLLIFAGISIFLFLVFQFTGKSYNLSQPLHGYYQRFFKGWILWFVSMTFLALYGGDFIFTQGISRFIILIVAFVSLIVLSVFDVFWNSLNSKLERVNPYKLLALYEDQEMLDKFLDEFEDYPIYDIRAIQLDHFNAKRSWDDVDLVVMVGTFETDIAQEIADHARIRGKLLYHVTESYFLEDLTTESARLGPIVAMVHKAGPLDGWHRVWKRIFDMVCSVIALLILLPVFIIVAIAIKIDSRGPIFFVQKRVGRKEKSFSFIKFRSMYTQFSTGEQYGGVEAERLYRKLIRKRNTRDDILPKIENDPRVTRVGRVLRKTSLDELPNLICILLGTMSFVGPRPHLPGEVEKYEPRMHRLFAVKPGLTGYAQIFGRDSLPFREEATLDLYYIQNRSLAMDLQVLISTVKVIFAGR